MLIDYHVHTLFSDDSDTPMEEAIRQAVILGLNEICFTEHIDYGVKEALNCNCEAYFEELKRCRQEWGNRICIRSGMEFGMQSHTISRFQETFDKYPGMIKSKILKSSKTEFSIGVPVNANFTSA